MPKQEQRRRQPTTDGLTPAIREYNRMVEEWHQDPANLRSRIKAARLDLAQLEIGYLERLWAIGHTSHPQQRRFPVR